MNRQVKARNPAELKEVVWRLEWDVGIKQWLKKHTQYYIMYFVYYEFGETRGGVGKSGVLEHKSKQYRHVLLPPPATWILPTLDAC